MPSCNSGSTGTNKHESVAHGAGTPEQRSFRGVLRDNYEAEGARLVAAVLEDIDSTGLTDEEIADRTGVDRPQLSRIRHGCAHVPGRLVAFAVDQSRHRPPRCVDALCTAAEGEFKPKPPASVEDRHAATLDVLHEMGIEEVVREKVARRLGVSAVLGGK